MHPRPTRHPPSSAAAGGSEMTIAMAVSPAAGCSARITVSASLMLSVKPARHRISPSARYHTGSLSLNRRVPRALRDVVRSRLTISMRPLEPSRRQIKYPRSTGDSLGNHPRRVFGRRWGVSFLPCGSCELVSACRDQMASAGRSLRNAHGLPLRLGLSGVNQTAFGRDHRKLEPVGDPDLLEHAGEVVLDGLRADAALTGDLLVRAPGHDHRQHLTLAWREPVREPCLRPRWTIRSAGVPSPADR